MGQSKPFTTRSREPAKIITADEAAHRAQELFSTAELLPIGNARTAVLKEACRYRMLAEMKRAIALPEGDRPAR